MKRDVVKIEESLNCQYLIKLSKYQTLAWRLLIVKWTANWSRSPRAFTADSRELILKALVELNDHARQLKE